MHRPPRLARTFYHQYGAATSGPLSSRSAQPCPESAAGEMRIALKTIRANYAARARTRGAKSPPALRANGGSGGGEVFLNHHWAAILTFCACVAVDELDYRDRRRIRSADAGLDDPGIAAVAARIARRNHIEELGELRVIHQSRLGEPAITETSTLCECHQLLNVR